MNARLRRTKTTGSRPLMRQVALGVVLVAIAVFTVGLVLTAPASPPTLRNFCHQTAQGIEAGQAAKPPAGSFEPVTVNPDGSGRCTPDSPSLPKRTFSPERRTHK